MDALLKISVLVGCGLLLAIGVLAVFMMVRIQSPVAGDPSVKYQLERIARELNRRVDEDLGPDLRFTGAEANPDGMAFNFVMPNLSNDEATRKYLYGLVRDNSRRMICAEERLWRVLKEPMVYLETNYYGGDGEIIASVRIRSEDCLLRW